VEQISNPSFTENVSLRYENLLHEKKVLSGQCRGLMEKQSAKRKKEWMTDILHKIIGALNQTVLPYVTINSTFERESSDDVRHMLAKQIFGIDNPQCAPASEPISSDTSFRLTPGGELIVYPLSLGNVACCQTPLCRSTEHPMNVPPKPWFSALRGISFDSLCCPQEKRLVFQVSDKALSCGSVMEKGGEHRWREYKMCDTLEIIDSSVMKKYLLESFLPCVHAVQVGHTAQLWVGICDANNAVIGVNESPRYVIEEVFAKAIENSFAHVFPPIPSECIKVIIHAAIGSHPTDWGDRTTCYRSGDLSTAQAREALQYFVGRCVMEKYECEESLTWTVSVETQTYETTCSLIFGAQSPVNGDGDTDPIQLAVSAYHKKRQECKDYQQPNYLQNWSKEGIEDISEPRRIVVCVEVSLPPHLCHTVCLQTNLSPYSYIYDGTIGASPLPLPPFQIWLRAKGLRDGAICSNLFLTLTSDDSICVLVLQDDQRRRLEASLRQYTNNRIVSITYEVSSDPRFDPSPLHDLKFNKHRDIVLITTWGSESLAQQTAEFLTAHSIPFRTLMFTSLHDLLPCRDLATTLVPLKLQDVAILIDSSAIQNNEEESPASIPIDHLVEKAPSRKQIPRDQILERMGSWISGNEPLSWDLLDANVVTTTLTATNLLTQVRANKRRGHTIFKKYPGSGATTLMHTVGWTLERSGEANVLIVKSSLTADFWKKMSAEMLDDGWLILLVDDHIDHFNDGIPPSSRFPFRITIIRVATRSANGSFLVSPILAQSCLESMCSRLCEIVTHEDTGTALRALVAYALEHPDERENRHLYVVMHTAIKGAFTPPRIFFERQIPLMSSDFERQAIMFLAFLSLYSTPFRRIEATVLSSLSEAALELTSFRNREIGFLHPSLADLYLTAACPQRSEPEIIWEIFENFNSFLASRVPMTGDNFILLYRSVLIHTPETNFTAFQQRMIDNRCDEELVDKIFDCERVKMYCADGFRQIACSRIHRHLDHVDRALALARIANSLLENDRNHSNLAKNNLAQALGAYAVANQDQGALNEMGIMFDDLETKDNTNDIERQKQKWLRMFQQRQREVS
jgi:hypothetical protein